MGPFKNILVVGASGSIGAIIVKGLLAEPSLTITALQRASSKGVLPAGLRAISIPDDYPTEDLVAAFRGQDVVLNTMATGSVSQQHRFIDAAIAAGVKRYIPSEFGLNNMNPDAQALTRVFAQKGAVQAYLRQLGDEGKIEWMSVTPGLWIRWNMERDLVGMHVAEGRMVFWDDGEAYLSCTTEENTALAVVRALTTHTDETRNRNLFLQDFKTTWKEVAGAIETVLGRKLKTENVDGETFIKQLKENAAAGDEVAQLQLIEPAFAMGIACWLEKEGEEIMNEKLGLPRRNVGDVVREAMEKLKLVN